MPIVFLFFVIVIAAAIILLGALMKAESDFSASIVRAEHERDVERFTFEAEMDYGRKKLHRKGISLDDFTNSEVEKRLAKIWG